MPAESLWLIDGHAQVFRCYYAPFRPLTAPGGEPTKATFLFFQMLLNILKQHRPDRVAAVFDVADETVFRVAVDPEYKAHRQPSPEDLGPQLDRILDTLGLAGVPVCRMPGFEADDLIATLCERHAGPNCTVTIVSRDKDLDQLLSEHVRLYDPARDQFVDAESMTREKGYSPTLAVEAQMLMGDSTDNVRGASGIGPKKAAELLARFGSVAEIIAHAGELTPKLAESVRAFAPRAEQVRQLVTLRRDVPFDFDWETAKVERFQFAAARPIFERLALRRLIEQISPDAGGASAAKTTASESSIDGESAGIRATATPATGSLFDAPAATVAVGHPRTRATLVDTPAALAELARTLAAAGRFAIDTETTGLSPIDCDLVGISMATAAGSGWYVPVRGLGQTLDVGRVRETLGPILADARIRKCGQNCKYDLNVLRVAGLPVAGVDFDSMVASFVLDSSRRSHGIDALALDLLGYTKIPTSDLIGRGKDQITMDRLPIGPVCEYACEDADIALRLCERFERELRGAPVERLFRELEMPLVEVLAEMEFNGIALDTGLLSSLSEEMSREATALVTEIHAAAGYPFNVDSTKQLADVLFDTLKLPVQKRTKTGRSTDAEVLETLVELTQHPVPRAVLAYRELAKLKGTYVDALPTMVSRRTGRVHPSFHQAVAVTGRLSCSDPNLQNIPIRTPSGARIRRAFVAGAADRVLLKADYSQIELRVLAHFCGDESLRAAFAADQDIHAFVASQVFGVEPGAVSKEQRARAKTVNFGIIYGQSAFGLARQTGMSRGEAQQFIDRYFARYPRIRGFLDDTVATARRSGQVETLLGRRRRIDDINSRNPTARAAAERFAVNTVVQGTAADLIKKAMLAIHARLMRSRGETRLLLQIHDELVFELPRAALADEARHVAAEMSGALPLSVPVRVDLAAGANWLDAERL
ncbi:MAG: DNA polymerase I [Phycisphaerae bacterium]